VSGVSWHATRVFFALNPACTIFVKSSQYSPQSKEQNSQQAEQGNFVNGKAVKALKQANSETTGAVKVS
jgi:hypothetical protein